eukprot:CAMPEP_0175090350 /NCGR_PEP_ID=MMETSP0086_2-20121207/1291_1 /TAXON_ID=136419 /ORGANISM="Unknown Unknown, Strain D1" /LENGTH=79 /DNA_ID=CAMNT_0016362957 /DNA_START=58 /DNA_END=297 /DNA_ORIENTATION=-
MTAGQSQSQVITVASVIGCFAGYCTHLALGHIGHHSTPMTLSPAWVAAGKEYHAFNRINPIQNGYNFVAPYAYAPEEEE